MFSQPANGAEAGAIFYSIIGNAKANGLTLFDSLMYLFNQFATENVT